MANRAAEHRVFADYHARKAPQTLRRKKADLLLFWEYLEAAGIPTGELMHDPNEWAGMTWGLVAGFVEWQLQQGYAINFINARLATVKRPTASSPCAPACSTMPPMPRSTP